MSRYCIHRAFAKQNYLCLQLFRWLTYSAPTKNNSPRKISQFSSKSFLRRLSSGPSLVSLEYFWEWILNSSTTNHFESLYTLQVFLFNFQLVLIFLIIFHSEYFFCMLFMSRMDEECNARRSSRQWKNINYTTILALCHFCFVLVEILIVPSFDFGKLNENLWIEVKL